MVVRSSRTAITTTTSTTTSTSTTTTTTSQTTTIVTPEASGLDVLPEADRKHHNSPIPIEKLVDTTTTTTTKLTTKTEELLYEDELENIRVEPVNQTDQRTEHAIEAFDYRHVL